MILNFHERVPQKGKYNLYYTFGKGYVNETRECREHYGGASSFIKKRSSIFDNLDDDRQNPLPNESALASDKNRSFAMSQRNNSSNNLNEFLNRSKGFDKFLTTKQMPQNGYGLNESAQSENKTSGLKAEMTLSSSMKQNSSLNKIRFGSSNRKERFENFSLNKKSDYPAEYSDINFLVTGNNQNKQKALNFYHDNFEIKDRNFDGSKINLSQNTDRLTTPLEKRLEIQEVKQNKEKYSTWKKDLMQAQKKYRITKTSFRSGILNIDNPKNEFTKVYQKEYEDYQRKEDEKEKILERHKKQIENFTKTHSDITFFNKNLRKKEGVSIERNSLIKITPQWTGKARIKEKFYKDSLETHDRLFGAFPHKFSIQRAENIMNCENKGKNWDIISMKNNDLQLKIDKGINGL